METICGWGFSPLGLQNGQPGKNSYGSLSPVDLIQVNAESKKQT